MNPDADINIDLIPEQNSEQNLTKAWQVKRILETASVKSNLFVMPEGSEESYRISSVRWNANGDIILYFK